MGSVAAAVRAVSSEAEAVEALKGWKPYSLRVVLLDGGERDVAVTTRRNRWAVARQILAGLPWVTIEALDRKKAILGILQRDDGADAPADQEDEEGDGTFVTIREEKLLDLMLRAQRVALDGQAGIMKTFLDQQAKLMSAMTDRNLRLEDELYNRAAEMRRLMTSGDSDDEKGGGLMSTDMIAMLMRLASAAPPPATAAKPKPNGAKVVDGAPAGAKSANPPTAKEG